MDGGFVLTPQDLNKIQKLIDDRLQRRINTIARPAGVTPDIQEIMLGEVYVGVAPYDGIPAMVRYCAAGTGSCDVDSNEVCDEPGYADCTLMRISPERDTAAIVGNVGIYQSPSDPKRVYNFATRKILSREYILAIKDKYGSYIAIPLEDTSSETTTTFDPTLSSWIAGLKTTDCLVLTVVKVDGDCSSVSATQELDLTYSSGSSWQSTTNFAFDGGSGPVVLTRSTPTPTMTINSVDGWSLGPDGSGGWLFAFGGSSLCAGSPVTCENSFVVRVTCSCCPISGWAGADKWYCIRAAGSGADCEPRYLTATDKCDTGLEICDGPFDTEADALVACPPPSPVSTSCCPLDTIPITRSVTISGPVGCVFNGTWTLTYVSARMQWEYYVTGNFTDGGDAILLYCSPGEGDQFVIGIATFFASQGGQSGAVNMVASSFDCTTATGSFGPTTGLGGGLSVCGAGTYSATIP